MNTTATGISCYYATDDLIFADRPKTRGDCLTAAQKRKLPYYLPEHEPLTDGTNCERPCPWVSCRHHLYLEVNEDTGAIRLNFKNLQVWEMTHTCSLDVADEGSYTLREVGNMLDLTRERIRQLETNGMHDLTIGVKRFLGDKPRRK